MKALVVDDQRIFKEAPDYEWTHATTSQEGLDALFLKGPWDEIWLDHDLGMESNGSGYDLVQELIYVLEDSQCGREDVLNPGGRIWVHSMNFDGANRMVQALTRYFEVARIDPTPYLDFEKMYSENRNPYLAGPRR